MFAETDGYRERREWEIVSSKTPTGCCPYVYYKHDEKITFEEMLKITTFCYYKCPYYRCSNFGKESLQYKQLRKTNKKTETVQETKIEVKSEVKPKVKKEVKSDTIDIGGLHFPASWGPDLARSWIDYYSK